MQTVIRHNKDRHEREILSKMVFTTPKFITVAIAAFGLFLYFIGLCVAQSAIPFNNFNGYGVYWYFLFFLIAWVIGSIISIMNQGIEEYRLLLVAWTAIAISYMPSAIQGTLAVTAVGNGGTFVSGNGLMVAGLIIIVLCLFVFLAMVSTKDTSIFNTVPGIPGTNKKAKTTEPVIAQV
jgi:hypothetical protein